MNPYFIFLVRLVLALIWLYNGLWMKVVVVDVHHLAIVTGLTAGTNLAPLVVMKAIGSLETLLAAGILSGLFHRFINYFQIAIMLLMNIIAITCSHGAIAHPFGLILSNMPTVLCALMVAFYGPGSWALSFGQGRAVNSEASMWKT